MRLYTIIPLLTLTLLFCTESNVMSQETISLYNAVKGGFENLEKVNKTNEEWKKLLTKEQYHITREHGTERAGTGELLNNKKQGVYQCVACSNHLFLSGTKFESGTGWPSFYEAVAQENIELKVDTSFFMRRVEVLCNRCGSHLGHVFDDGPPPTGKRFCINSAALKFLEKK